MSDIAASAGTIASAADGAASAAAGARVGDFIALMKPRVMSLVVFSGVAGMLVAPGDLHPVIAAVAILCIAVGAGASGAINMWYDRDIDAVMQRTRGRPIPTGRVDADEAASFGVVLAIGSVTLMALAVNLLAAGLLALTIAFYVVVYTIWLKRRTPQNIVIGGAAGAFPPLIGWAATTGQIGLPALALFLLIFLWTPPHFWALALYRAGDYAKAGVPMMPVVAGARATKLQMLAYTLLLFPVALAPWLLGLAGALYAGAATLLGLLFILAAVRVWFDAGERAARQMFAFSILYLFLLFTLLIVDRAPGLFGGSPA